MQVRSARLNRQNKDKFIRTVLEDRLPSSKKPDLEHFKARWVTRIYDIAYKDYVETMQKLPSWFFTCSKKLMVSFADTLGTVSFELPTEALHVKNNDGYYGANTAPIPPGHIINTEYKNFLQKQKDYDVQYRQLQTQLLKLIDSCNTSAQLYAAWPEAVKYKNCFPYVPQKRFQGAAVSSKEIEIGLLLSEANVSTPQESE